MSLGQDGPPTRTRMPEGHGTHGVAPRRPKPSRTLVTVVGVIVVLVAAIAFANRGGDRAAGPSATGGGTKGSASNPTAPTGTDPVSGKNAGIASGFARTTQGAQSAAANYAVVLVSADILKPGQRHAIVQQLFTTDKVARLQDSMDQAYSRGFLSKLGLDAEGNAPQNMTYVSRTAPVGTKATQYSPGTATVEVWCTGVFGTAGVGSTTPVTNDWFTMTLKLRWEDNDWKVDSFAQKEGPAPVNTDRTASSADEIAKAVQQYGGFTYAR